MKKSIRYLLPSALAIALALVTSACNVFDPVDNPGSDAQYLSAARAAFDQGRFDEAASFYGQLSSEYAEVAASESAFQILDQYGASMGAFMSAFGKGGDIGSAFTRLAASLAANGGTPGKDKRLGIFGAFKKVDSITGNPELRGLIRFVAGAALLAEILSENVGTSGTFTTRDLVANPTACAALDTTTCPAIPNSACAIPGGKQFVDSVTKVTLTRTAVANRPYDSAAEGTTQLGATRPNFQMVQAAFEEINFALTHEIAAGGSLGGSTEMFTDAFMNVFGLVLDASPNCYRQGLLINGVGVN